jgi:hypothetical protein
MTGRFEMPAPLPSPANAYGRRFGASMARIHLVGLGNTCQLVLERARSRPHDSFTSSSCRSAGPGPRNAALDPVQARLRRKPAGIRTSTI